MRRQVDGQGSDWPLADGERVFSYRLTRIARGDQTPLAGFDENAWAKTAPHRRRRIATSSTR
jgi:hypothetical protein